LVPPGGLVNILCFYSELSNRELNTKCIQKLILYDTVLASTQARATRQTRTMENDCEHVLIEYHPMSALTRKFKLKRSNDIEILSMQER